MKWRKLVIVSFAACFVVLSLCWGFFVHQRCVDVMKKPIIKQVKKPRFESLRKVVREVVSKPRKKAYVYAKPYHVILFWVIILLEIVCIGAYLASGISLFRFYPFGRKFAIVAVTLHAFFSTVVVGFMKYGAIPLQQMTHKKNILLVYYMPSKSLHSAFSSYVTGLRVFQPNIWIYVGVYIFILGGCVFFFTRPSVAQLFKKK